MRFGMLAGTLAGKFRTVNIHSHEN